MGIQPRGWVLRTRECRLVVFNLAVWPGHAVAFGRVSPVVWGEVSEAARSGDPRTVLQRVGSGRIVFAPV